MEYWEGAVWIAGQALYGLVWFWPVTVALIALLVAVAIRAALRKQLSSRCVAWALGPVVVPIALLTWGIVFSNADAGPPYGELGWAAKGVYVLLFSIIPLAAWSVWMAKGCRWVVVSCSSLIAWYSVWLAWLCGMSVTGDWI